MKKNILLTNFKAIYKNTMKDIPITNNELEVEAVGFKKFEKYELGVLITPWFMNIILIPETKDDIYQDTSHKKITIGDKIDIKFSAKSYTFLAQKDDTLGFYLSCSLFSPMFDFKSQIDARAVAKEVIKQIMQEKQEEDKEKKLTRRNFLTQNVN